MGHGHREPSPPVCWRCSYPSPPLGVGTLRPPDSSSGDLQYGHPEPTLLMDEPTQAEWGAMRSRNVRCMFGE